MKNIFVIIVTYNGMKWLEVCLKSLRASNYPLHIVVVDNNSNDNTIKYLSEQKDIYFIANKTNKGFGQANNQGIEYGMQHQADYFLLINQDAYINPNTIEKLLETSTWYKDAAIIAPVHLNGNGEKIDAYFLRTVFPSNEDFLSDMFLNRMKRNYIVDNVPAAGWFLPRKTIQELGGFDPLFFHYCEDDHYLQRLRFHHKQIILDTEACIKHDREGTLGNVNVYIRKKRRRDLILLASDINLNSGQLIQKIGRSFIEYAILNLFYLITGKWNMMWNYISDFSYLLFHYSMIAKSRRKNKIIASNWLNL